MISRISIKDIQQRIFHSNLAKDSFWALLGKTLGSALSLFAGIIVARFLGKEVYGEYGMVKTTLIQVSVFSTFGLGYTITKYIAQLKNDTKNDVRQVVKIALSITCVFSGFMSILLFIFAKQVAVLLNAPYLYNMLRISAFAIFFNAITTTQIGALSGFKAFKIIAINNFLAGIVTFILSVVLTLFYGLEGSVLALALSLFINCVINNVSLRRVLKRYPKLYEIKRTYIKEILAFSFPIALQESSYSIVQWSLTFVLIKLSTYGELGIYNAAAQWSAIIGFLPGVLQNVMFSYFCESADDTSKHKKLVNIMLILNISITIVPFLLVFIFSNFICSFYGKTFTGMENVLNITIFSSVISALISVFNNEFISKGKTWFLFITRLIRDVLLIVITYITISFFKNISAALILAIVSLTMYTLYCMFLALIYYKKTNNNYA